ncbi:hypothetical protein [Paraburkholderia silvatlantica]|uniref:Porin n=1 Tax=Paraburkholderia silvatlantica TaxID=321895 RepID=A0ABR6FVR6_9BURK|nr:hypothetical protein [Paraburkholderia silvatlantica]MBB2931526.1 putative porin [Paraburkholderia silvatlantica]PVY27810.1 hypothetical protein C7411_1183 [Paraburkholderia silvatlantica]PXW34657.1 hypothetical protein C7413_1173 [Paraburkholderia silvatlantica]TDQ98499.1 hypothetical protein C7412_105124 [Paraburkholderia silvatlantica]
MVRFGNFKPKVHYALTPALEPGIVYVQTNGHVTDTATYGADPKWSQVNAQVIYSHSSQTDVFSATKRSFYQWSA